MSGVSTRPSAVRLVVGAMVGWFLPLLSLPVAVGLLLWSGLQRRGLGQAAWLAATLVVPAAIHLALTLPVTAIVE